MGKKLKSFGFIFIILVAGLAACGQPERLTPAPVPTQTPVPSPSPVDPTVCTEIGQTWVSPVDGMTMVCVPSGKFWMGAADTDTHAGDDEKPRHQVSLDAFWIDRMEVTNAMFEKCVAAGACHERTYSPYLWGVHLPNGTPYYGEPTYNDDPVIMLDGDEAITYCKWAGRRLPTEAEWEKAARGTDERIYPWGADLDCEHAVYLGCEKEQRPSNASDHPLGVSPYGAVDMAGNLWEWASDWYSENYYSASPAQNPTGPATGEFHTIRGGGWHSNPTQLRSTNRSTGKPEHSTDGEIGFRCAMNSK